MKYKYTQYIVTGNHDVYDVEFNSFEELEKFILEVIGLAGLGDIEVVDGLCYWCFNAGQFNERVLVGELEEIHDVFWLIDDLVDKK